MTEQGELFKEETSGGPGLNLDDEFYSQGIRALIGIDEAGRGPLAGPVSAAAVSLPANFSCAGLNDSKKLNEKKREELFQEFHERRNKDMLFGVGFSSAQEIDSLGILPANFLAMRRAIQELMLSESRELEDFCLLIDGRDKITGLEGIQQIPVIKGDSRARCIAAASVLAKVSRDRKMLAHAEDYPGYGFEKHKGYGTRAHMEALQRLGPCEIHRTSFAPVRRAMVSPGQTS